MEATVYNRRAWRELPRDGDCVVSWLFGQVVGPCAGTMHRHHVDPRDPDSRSVQVCASHHPSLQAALRRMMRGPRGCPHRPGTHRYPWALEECERKHAAA